MGSFWWDVRFGFRALFRRPGIATLAIVSLAIGIGANTAIFSFLSGALIRPLPVHEPQALVVPNVISPNGHQIGLSIPDFKDWRDGAQSFEYFGGNRINSRTLTGGEQPEIVSIREILGDFFEVFGGEPALGRLIGSNETWAGAEPVAVVSNGYWQRNLGGAQDVLGRALTLDGRTFEIVGVLPPELRFPPEDSEVFVPLGVYSDEMCWEQRSCTEGLWAIARLKEGVALGMAQADLDRVTDVIAESEGQPVSTAKLQPLTDRVVGGMRAPVWILMGAVVLVLLIAVANVATLLLSLGESRRLEIALRLGLGAGRTQLLRQLLTESLIISLSAAALGVGLAFAAVRLMVHSIGAQLPPLVADRIAVDIRVLAFTLGAALAAGVALALAPAAQAFRLDPGKTLKEGGRGIGGVGRQALLSVLVAAEVALATVLLIGAALMIRSLGNLRDVDKGFVAEGVLTAEISLPLLRYDSRDASWQFFEELRDRVAALPGIAETAVTNAVPLSGMSWDLGVSPEGAADTNGGVPSALYYMVSPEYLDVLGLSLIAGRGFSEADRNGSDLVCLVDETLAERFWPGESAVGKRVTFERERGGADGDRIPVYRRVVGVVRHVRQYKLQTPSLMQLYVPIAQSRNIWSPLMFLMVKTERDPSAVAGQIRREIRDIDSEVPIGDVQTMRELVDRAMGGNRIVGGLLGVFSVVALVLSAIGVFGVAWYSATRRKGEIGVRIVLGARPWRVVRTLSKRAVAVTALGEVIGIAAAVGLSRLLAGMLFQVQPIDAAVYVQIALFLAGTSVLATCIPTISATRIDPAVLLREE